MIENKEIIERKEKTHREQKKTHNFREQTKRWETATKGATIVGSNTLCEILVPIEVDRQREHK